MAVVFWSLAETERLKNLWMLSTGLPLSDRLTLCVAALARSRGSIYAKLEQLQLHLPTSVVYARAERAARASKNANQLRGRL